MTINNEQYEIRLHDLLRDPPKLHRGPEGQPVSWRAGDRLLQYLDGFLKEGMKTLETGAGLSTLVFAMHHCEHTVVVPDEGQIERIIAWCSEKHLDTGCLTFHAAPSEDVLPTLSPTHLDCVLIDGAHGFPLPFIDWFYAGRRLGVGRRLIVDDIQLWTGRVLSSFLKSDPQWQIEQRFRLEFVVAERKALGSAGEWCDQPYVRDHSFTSQAQSPLHRTVGRLHDLEHITRAAKSLVFQGEARQMIPRFRAYRRFVRPD